VKERRNVLQTNVAKGIAREVDVCQAVRAAAATADDFAE
jgi:hypothetical protein